jgi:hypothetical protein
MSKVLRDINDWNLVSLVEALIMEYRIHSLVCTVIFIWSLWEVLLLRKRVIVSTKIVFKSWQWLLVILIVSVRLSPKHPLTVRRLIINELTSHQISSLCISIEIGLVHAIVLLNNEWWVIVLEDLVQRGCSCLP